MITLELCSMKSGTHGHIWGSESYVYFARICYGLTSEEFTIRFREGSRHNQIVVLRDEFQVGDCEWCKLCKVTGGLLVVLETFLVPEEHGHHYAILHDADDFRRWFRKAMIGIPYPILSG